jgi:hypothetical protein
MPWWSETRPSKSDGPVIAASGLATILNVLPAVKSLVKRHPDWSRHLNFPTNLASATITIYLSSLTPSDDF